MRFRLTGMCDVRCAMLLCCCDDALMFRNRNRKPHPPSSNPVVLFPIRVLARMRPLRYWAVVNRRSFQIIQPPTQPAVVSSSNSRVDIWPAAGGDAISIDRSLGAGLSRVGGLFSPSLSHHILLYATFSPLPLSIFIFARIGLFVFGPHHPVLLC